VGIDLLRVATSAVDSFLDDRERSRDSARPEKGGHRRLGARGAVALGAGLAVAARVAYGRVRRFDLERLGTAAESRLKRG
jgi:hypothetical protein